ncbi:MAG: hypothetical protein WD737_02005 [Gemmatimonadota bacterium]
MKRLPFRLRSVLVGVVAIIALLTPLVLWSDYVSVERGNRLFRVGELVSAIRVYQKNVQPDAARPDVSYNLGTAWLALGSTSEAEARLHEAAGAPTPDVRYRAYYNLGYLLFDEASQLSEREMAAPLLGESVLAYREALRLNPGSDDARWSLAVAMAALDSVMMRQVAGDIRVPTREFASDLEDPNSDSGGQADLGGSEESGGGEGEGIISPDDRRNVGGGGARETLAEEVAGGDRQVNEVARILEDVTDEPGLLLRRILVLEGPKGWFSSQSTPGGRW